MKRFPFFGLVVALALPAVLGAATPSAFGGARQLPGVPERPDIISLAPLSQTNWVGELVTHTATISDQVQNRVGVTVTFTVLQGPSTGRTFTGVTDSSGQASFTYTIPSPGQPLTSLPNAGADQIQATFTDGGKVFGSNWIGQGWSQGAVGQEVPGRSPALVKTPDSNGFTVANPTQDLPPGTLVDVSGTRSIGILNYYLRQMVFSGVADQVPSRFALISGLRTAGKAIQIQLIGGNFKTCTVKGRSVQGISAGAKKHKPVRRLWGSGKGRYVTKGKYASATVRGTTWLVADYCDGTLVKVRSGRVIVRDLVRHKNVVVSNGHAYFAKAP